METTIILELIIKTLKCLVEEGVIRKINETEYQLSFSYNEDSYTIQHIISQFYLYLITEIRDSEMIKHVLKIVKDVDEYFSSTNDVPADTPMISNIREFIFNDIDFADVKEFI